MDLQTIYHFRNNFFNAPKYYNDLILYQIGEALCEINTEINNHTHLDWYEFTYVLSGKGEIFTNNIATPVTKGDLYFSLPREIHRISSDSIEPLRYFFVAFNVTEASPLHPFLERHREILADETKRGYRAEAISRHFQHLLFEIKQEAPLHRLIFEYELKTVITKILSMIEPSDDAISYSSHRNNNKQLLCFNIANYIDDNIMQIDNAMSLSYIFGYNYTYLSRFFKKVTGENISSYITNKKLNLAKSMLEAGDMSVTEISNELHYSSIHVFSRAFKDKFHISPTDFRTLAGKKK